MDTDHFIHGSWQRDIPPASDMTFVLATLQRIERRRFLRSMCGVFLAGMLAMLLLWQFLPLLTVWLMPVLEMLRSMTQLELVLMSLVTTVVIYLEVRIFR